MSSYTSNKHQTPIFRDCPHCKQSISATFSYCPHCGWLLVKQSPSYIDPSIFVTSQSSKKPLHIDYPIKPVVNEEIWASKKYCPHCGQLITRLEPPDISSIYIPKTSDSSSSSSCFIATACNADAETLNTFYNFRDEILLGTPLGKRAVHFYYRFSPGVAKLIQGSELLQSSILSMLLKPLAALLRLTVLHSKKP